MSQYAKLINIMKAKFYIGLRERTGWGRNQVMELFNNVMAESLAEILDNQDEQHKAKDKGILI